MNFLCIVPYTWVHISICSLSQRFEDPVHCFWCLDQRDHLSSWLEPDSERRSIYQFSCEECYTYKSNHKIVLDLPRRVLPASNRNHYYANCVNKNFDNFYFKIFESWILNLNLNSIFFCILESSNSVIKIEFESNLACACYSLPLSYHNLNLVIC